jgi:hypothetical protein
MTRTRTHTHRHTYTHTGQYYASMDAAGLTDTMGIKTLMENPATLEDIVIKSANPGAEAHLTSFQRSKLINAIKELDTQHLVSG